MRFDTKITIPKQETEALKSCILNGIANVLYGEGRESFVLTPEQSEELEEFKERLSLDVDWFIYEKDGGVERE